MKTPLAGSRKAGGHAKPLLAFPQFEEPLKQLQKTDPDQIRVFVLGDSQSLMSFGAGLQSMLVGGGCEVLFHGVKNGTPYFWKGEWPSPVLTRIFTRAASPEECGQFTEVAMRPRSVKEYVESFDPDVFVFQGGTNFEVDLAVENGVNISNLIQESAAMAASRGARVLWIGPPDARDDVRNAEFQERAVATLRAALAEVTRQQGYDCFFDSRPACPIPNDSAGDGEHPSDNAALTWAGEAAKWVHESISHLTCDGNLRSIGSLPLTPLPGFITQATGDDSEAPSKAFEVELQLVAKSDPGDIGTLPYTDAFSVYQYRLRNARGSLPELVANGLSVPGNTVGANQEPTIYVLHWAVHNSGVGPRATRMATREVGSTCVMKLTPLATHPLKKALGTMVQFNDFDNFTAPLFLASNFLEERAF